MIGDLIWDVIGTKSLRNDSAAIDVQRNDR